MHVNLGGYHVSDIEFVAAFDIDKNKVGKDLSEAIYTKPNNTYVFQQVPHTGVTVERGMTHDGLGKYLSQIIEKAPGPTADIVGILKEREVDVMVSYLPVGSEEATKWYVEQALQAGVGFVNAIPVFIGREPYWQRRFAEAGLPVIGDDIKSQVGATITHRVLTRLFMDRGVRLDRTYQLNFGGNTDFLNMLERERLESKKISKTNAVTSMLDYEIDPDDIHVGPSDHVPWLLDRKWCYIRMEGTTFGDVPLNAELKLEVWDSPNSAGVITDAIRCLKLGLDRGLKGTLVAPSSYFMKSPPHQIHDDIAFNRVEAFIRGEDNETLVGTEAPVKKTVKADGGHQGQGGHRRQVTDGERRLEAPHRRGGASPRIVERSAVLRLPLRVLAAAHPAAAADRRRPGPRGPGLVPALADEARLVEPELRARPGPAARRPARPPPRAARLPRVRALPRRAHARADDARRPGRRTHRALDAADIQRIRDASPIGGIIVTAAHVGNNDVIGAAIAHLGCRSASWPTTRRSRSSSTTSAGSASEWHATMIPWRNLRAIFGVLRRREMLGLLVDWGYRSDGIPVKLFDAWTTLPAGPATLAAKTSSLIVPAITTRRQPDGRLRVTWTSRSSSPRRTRPTSSARPRRSPTRSPRRSGRRRSSGTASSRSGRPPAEESADLERRAWRCRPGCRIPDRRERTGPRDEADRLEATG